MHEGIVFDIKRYAIHDGPGIRTTVFFKGCPMHCRWCHNPEGIRKEAEIVFRENLCKQCNDCLTACPEGAIISKNHTKIVEMDKCTLCGSCTQVCYAGALEIIGKRMTVGEVMNEITKDAVFFEESGGGATFSGGEPLLQFPFLLALLEACKKRNLHTTVDTSGYCSYDELEAIRGVVDLFLYDLKTMDDSLHVHYTGVSNTLILENLQKLSFCKKPIIVRVPLIPGINDSATQLETMAKFLLPYPSIKEIHLLPYHPWGRAKFDRLFQPDFIIEDFSKSEKSAERAKIVLEKSGFAVNIGG